MKIRLCPFALNIALWATIGLALTGFNGGLVRADESSDRMEKFEDLQANLQSRGFEVLLQLPPQEGAYGLLESRTKTIWINPVVFELQIALPVLIHEGVHAAQVCEGDGVVAALALDIQPPSVTRPWFLRYHTYRRQIESEAYAVQVQPDAYELVTTLLEKHC